MGFPGLAEPKPTRFFLSYSHADARRDGVLRTFAVNLRAAVSERLTITSDEAGFIDGYSIGDGSEWAKELGAALRTSYVLVCLVSKSYLESESCGKELGVFLRRMTDVPEEENPPLILPIVWDPKEMKQENIPVSLSRFQIGSEHFPDEYRRRGARSIAISGDAKAYSDLITAITNRVVLGAETQLAPLPSAPPLRWEELPNALIASAPTVGSPAAAQLPIEIFAPFRAKVLYAIPAPAELAGLRKADSYSANGAWWWKPFPPPAKYSIGQMVKLASVAYFHEDVFFEHPNLYEHLKEDHEEQGVVIVVDPWASLIDSWVDTLQALDELPLHQRAVIVVRNCADAETEGRGQELLDCVTGAFPICSKFTKDLFCTDVCDADSFSSTLSAVLDRLNDAVIKQRANRRIRTGVRAPVLTTRPQAA